MSEEMFCFQCQEACGNTGCTVRGVCGKSAETANKMDRLIAELKRIALILYCTGRFEQRGRNCLHSRIVLHGRCSVNLDKKTNILFTHFRRKTNSRASR